MVEAVSNRSRRRVSPDLSTRGIPNESRFGTAVHTIQGYSLRLALHRCANRYDAEDVLQDVFLAYRNTKIVFADDEHLKAWLIRVTINQCRRRFCSPWRTKTIFLADMTAAADGAAGTLTPEQLDEQADRAALQTALKQLKPDDRILIYLYYFEGLSFESLAGVMNRSPGSLRTRLYRLRQRLKSTGQAETNHPDNQQQPPMQKGGSHEKDKPIEKSAPLRTGGQPAAEREQIPEAIPEPLRGANGTGGCG